MPKQTKANTSKRREFVEEERRKDIDRRFEERRAQIGRTDQTSGRDSRNTSPERIRSNEEALQRNPAPSQPAEPENRAEPGARSRERGNPEDNLFITLQQMAMLQADSERLMEHLKLFYKTLRQHPTEHPTPEFLRFLIMKSTLLLEPNDVKVLTSSVLLVIIANYSEIYDPVLDTLIESIVTYLKRNEPEELTQLSSVVLSNLLNCLNNLIIKSPNAAVKIKANKDLSRDIIESIKKYLKVFKSKTKLVFPLIWLAMASFLSHGLHKRGLLGNDFTEDSMLELLLDFYFIEIGDFFDADSVVLQIKELVELGVISYFDISTEKGASTTLLYRKLIVIESKSKPFFNGRLKSLLLECPDSFPKFVQEEFEILKEPQSNNNLEESDRKQNKAKLQDAVVKKAVKPSSSSSSASVDQSSNASNLRSMSLKPSKRD